MLITSVSNYAQDLKNDTIQLQNLNIKAKEPKLKTVNLNKGNTFLITYQYETPEATYLVENLPYGEVQEITLYFFYLVKNYNAVSKIEETRYEMTLYDISENGTAGKKINSQPIPIILKKSRKSELKNIIDVSAYKLKTSRFLINLVRTSELPCYECGLYLPRVIGSTHRLYYIGPISEYKVNIDSHTKNNENSFEGLQCKIKTITRYY